MTHRESLMQVLQDAKNSVLFRGPANKRGTKDWFENEIINILSTKTEEEIKNQDLVRLYKVILDECIKARIENIVSEDSGVTFIE